MLNQPAGNSTELPSQANRKFLEHESREIVREVHQTLQTSGLDKFTFSFLDLLWHTLNGVIRHVDRLPEATFKELVEIIDGLRRARNELQLACFLFHVEEIPTVYRMILRNRAAQRGRKILQRMLRAWPPAVAG